MSKIFLLLLILVCAFAAMAQDASDPDVTQGSLFATTRKGKPLGICPLKTTTVSTDVSGFVARVRVRQEFENTYTQPIEAIYTFPLSQNGAVDDMTMTIGTRVVRGTIMKREEARQVYETAKEEGKVASLLDQERPNIFTQSVANIMPGDQIVVEISYVETLKYEDGSYEFVFPMTVGERYIPSSVTDGSKISPPVAKDRPGHDISIEVNLNAAVPIEEIRSPSHDIQQINLTPSTAKITLRSEKTIPNRDFVLRYDVTGKKIEDAILATRDARGGFFSMVLQPPDRFTSEDITPKEIVFVLDTSGSMSGFPIEKAKEAMKLSIDGLHPNDTFNLITFAGDTQILFDGPVLATQGNLERAQAFLASRSGSGGTEMMKAIRAALDPSDVRDHVRIVCFMTDGYVGNEDEIIAEIARHPKARIFSFGIGNSVNRHLLDKMAEAGNGEVEYVSLEEEGTKAARRFYERVRTPLLTDISVDWNGMPVADIYPSRLPDLFSAKPVVLNGRFTKPWNGKIRLIGKVAGQEYSREIAVNLPEAEAANDVLATLWARKRIDEITARAGDSAERVAESNAEVTRLGLEFRLLTANTSFVAVEERIVNRNGKPVKVRVPVAVPEGSEDTPSRRMEIVTGLQRPPAAVYSSGVLVSGGGGGGGQSATVDVTASSKVSRRSAKRKSVSGSGSGDGSGNGVGYGSGSGSGRGGPPPAAMAKVTTPVQNSPASVNALVLVPGAGLTTAEQLGLTTKVETTQGAAPDALKAQARKDKLHAWVFAVMDRLAKNTPAAPNESLFVRDGKAEIKISLSKRSPEIIEKLRQAGFEMVSEKDKTLKGRIAIEKLAALVDIEEVELVMPLA